MKTRVTLVRLAPEQRLRVLDFGLVTRTGSEKTCDLRLEGTEGLADATVAPHRDRRAS